MSPALAPTLTLTHGAEIPVLGLGTWPLDDAGAETAVARALESGYRHVDTAYAYGNERGVGRGLRAAGVPREEVFVTSKFNVEWHSVDGVQEAFRMSVDKLGTDYLDLFLIHWPNPGRDRYVDAYRGLVRLLEQGHVRAIGLSNFKPAHTDRVLDGTRTLEDAIALLTRHTVQYAKRQATWLRGEARRVTVIFREFGRHESPGQVARELAESYEQKRGEIGLGAASARVSR